MEPKLPEDMTPAEVAETARAIAAATASLAEAVNHMAQSVQAMSVTFGATIRQMTTAFDHSIKALSGAMLEAHQRNAEQVIFETTLRGAPAGVSADQPYFEGLMDRLMEAGFTPGYFAEHHDANMAEATAGESEPVPDEEPTDPYDGRSPEEIYHGRL